MLDRNSDWVTTRYIFTPPAYTEDWPTIIGECGDSQMRQCLKGHGGDARGSKYLHYHDSDRVVLIDGHVHTDDIPFWLSLMQSDKQYHIVYGI